MPTASSNVSESLMTMVFNKQIMPEQAVTILNPLYQVLETAKGQLTTADQRKTTNVKKALDKVKDQLLVMDKKLRPRVLYRLFARSRVKAFEQANALVTICEQCPKGAKPNATMIDQWLKTSGIEKRQRTDLQELTGSLKRYAKQLVG